LNASVVGITPTLPKWILSIETFPTCKCVDVIAINGAATQVSAKTIGIEIAANPKAAISEKGSATKIKETGRVMVAR
jgi:hypothetical protein